MSVLAIIGGSGFCSYNDVEIEEKKPVHTPFGEPSSLIWRGMLQGKPVIFMPRHGDEHHIAPHRINYRANIWALHTLGVEKIIAVAAVGGIGDNFTPGTICIPDQIIDYTYGRESSFYSDDFSADKHFDFTYPYDESLRQQLISTAAKMDMDLIEEGTYGAVQGPRLETAAEILRMRRDGCDMVGMTGMPEAYLARELGIAYASCAVIANKAAGLSDGLITMEQIEQNLEQGLTEVRALLVKLIATQSL